MYFLRYKNKLLDVHKINKIIINIIYKKPSDEPDKPVNTRTLREDKLQPGRHLHGDNH